MNTALRHFVVFSVILILNMISVSDTSAQNYEKNNPDLDKRVREFLNSNENRWQDMNIPTSDGQLLYDIIVKNNYKNAVEIGTSTGHSGIWIAWALSKTGGKLTTIEIDEDRYKEALENFKKVGLSEYIDARLADAHQLVLALKGPIDFVFSDADKSWYINYFKALDPKLSPGGCFTAHNITRYNNRDYYNYVSKLTDYNTTLNTGGGGMAISYKKGN